MPGVRVTRGFLDLLLLLFACATFAAAADNPQALEREFQSAVADYDAGRYPDAASKLQHLVRVAPETFEVHELLGMVYSAQHDDAKAVEQLQRAVHLKPTSVPARTNLAATLTRLGKLAPAEEQFRKAVGLDPRSFDTNHNLGEFFIQRGNLVEAITWLQRAQHIRATYDNGYDLTLAYLELGRLNDARQSARDLLQQKDTAEL